LDLSLIKLLQEEIDNLDNIAESYPEYEQLH